MTISATRPRREPRDAPAVLNRCSFFVGHHDLAGYPIFTASTVARVTSGTLKKVTQLRVRLQISAVWQPRLRSGIDKTARTSQ
jgi:hypothetical protein